MPQYGCECQATENGCLSSSHDDILLPIVLPFYVCHRPDEVGLD
jgi:hypothetical protein